MAVCGAAALCRLAGGARIIITLELPNGVDERSRNAREL